MEDEEYKLSPKMIWNIIICVTIGILLTFSYLIYNEISQAKEKCEKLDGNYELIPFEHTCNNKTFVKYQDNSWDYEKKQFNLSKILKELEN